MVIQPVKTGQWNSTIRAMGTCCIFYFTIDGHLKNAKAAITVTIKEVTATLFVFARP
jgi:hypothetical protein